MAKEEWRACIGCPDYLVSDQGRIRSLKRGLGKRPPNGILRGALLKKRGRTPYVVVTFMIDGKKVGKSVHRLVLEAFVGPCPPGHEACHADGDGTNNALSNLRWGTSSSNNNDRKIHGRLPLGEDNAMSVLIEADVRFIRSQPRVRGVATRLAQKLGVSLSTVCRVLSGRTWTHVQ